MRSFLKSLSSILYDENLNFKIPTKAFVTSRFGITVYAGAKLTPELSHLALRAKEDNDLLARKFLATLVVQGINKIEDKKRNKYMELFPIPSRPEVNRIRGIKHVEELVKEVKKVYPVKSYEILKHIRKVKDQSTLTHLQRLENLDGAFAVIEKKFLPAQGFLIDDLVTSGATIKAAADALKESNIELLGVIAACATSFLTE